MGPYRARWRNCLASSSLMCFANNFPTIDSLVWKGRRALILSVSMIVPPLVGIGYVLTSQHPQLGEQLLTPQAYGEYPLLSKIWIDQLPWGYIF